MKCKHMGDRGSCFALSTADHFEYCVQGPCPHETPVTNADRIRAMSAEGLSEFAVLSTTFFCTKKYGEVCEKPMGCSECALDWLKQPAEKD